MEYRIYFLHSLDRGMGYVPVLQDDDSAAIEAAKRIAVKRPFELWFGRRLVFREASGAPRGAKARFTHNRHKSAKD